MSLKVYHISSAPFSGGAARAGFRLHEGLLREEGVESIWLDAEGSAHGSSVIKLSPPLKPSPLFLRLRRKKWAKINRRHFGPTTPPASNPIGWGSIEMLEKLPRPDVWNLHWVSWFLDWENLLPWMTEQAPIVWTLHDLNPLRGIWHYEPQSEERTPLRLRYEAEAIAIKKRALAKIPKDRIIFVGPSKWMVEECRKSPITAGFQVEHIPYGLDLDLFSPKSPSEFKAILGIPDSKTVLGFVADRLNDPRKGIQHLLNATEETLPKHPEIHLLIAGSKLGDLGGICHKALGPLHDDLLLAHFYSACDYFICPSLQDNLPNTVIEALACGTPVVAFNIGGLPDMIVPGESGFIGEKGCLADILKEALDFQKWSPAQYREMRAKTRARAIKAYPHKIQAINYTNLYNSLL
jgi:glycosyltransferase involved in cell wall biosynthesis